MELSLSDRGGGGGSAGVAGLAATAGGAECVALEVVELAGLLVDVLLPVIRVHVHPAAAATAVRKPG